MWFPSPQHSPLSHHPGCSPDLGCSLKESHKQVINSKAHNRAKSASTKETPKELLGVALYSEKELPAAFHLHRALKPLLEFKKIKNKQVCNPYLFRGAPMVTTFVHLAGSCTKNKWQFLNKISQVGIRLAELEHPSLKKITSFFAGQVPVYVYPSFYRTLKLKYPLDVRGLSRDGWVTTELGTNSLRYVISILTPQGFPRHNQQWVR